MASDTILQIVKDMAASVGINQPNTATGSTDPQIIQLVALATEEVRSLATRFGWQSLIREQTFVTVAAEDQGALVGGICPAGQPPKYIINETMYNRTLHVPNVGPLSPTGWQGLKAVTTVAGFYSRYRLRTGRLLFYPAPAAGQSVYFEYVAEAAISNQAGDTFKTRFTQDADFPVVDSQLVTLGLRWRWKAAKGLDYAEDFNTYERDVLDAMTRDKTAKPVSLDSNRGNDIRPLISVPAGNWMQP